MTVMRPRSPEELGRAARTALWKFASTTRLTGMSRDQAGVATIRSKFPGTRGLFSDQALAAVLREPQAGLCSWDALKVLTAAAGEPMPTAPTAALLALLGQPCSRCRISFEAGEVAERERRLIASGIRRPTTPAPAAARPALTSSARAATPRGRPSTPNRDCDVCPCARCESRRGW